MFIFRKLFGVDLKPEATTIRVCESNVEFVWTVTAILREAIYDGNSLGARVQNEDPWANIW